VDDIRIVGSTATVSTVAAGTDLNLVVGSDSKVIVEASAKIDNLLLSGSSITSLDQDGDIHLNAPDKVIFSSSQVMTVGAIRLQGTTLATSGNDNLYLSARGTGKVVMANGDLKAGGLVFNDNDVSTDEDVDMTLTPGTGGKVKANTNLEIHSSFEGSGNTLKLTSDQYNRGEFPLSSLMYPPHCCIVDSTRSLTHPFHLTDFVFQPNGNGRVIFNGPVRTEDFQIEGTTLSLPSNSDDSLFLAPESGGAVKFNGSTVINNLQVSHTSSFPFVSSR
jgi:hypothetical protein